MVCFYVVKFKVVLESNKIVVSKYGQFIVKGYECGSLFPFFCLDFYNEFVNHTYGNVNNLVSICQSCLCDTNFGSMSHFPPWV